MPNRPNPFKDRNEFYWRTKKERIVGPYEQYSTALYDLLKYCNYTDARQTRWQKFVTIVKRFLNA